jgi:hypothetical protein
MTPDADDLKRREEEKREAASDPLRRWRAIQNAITWAESQATGQRNTPARCHALEQAKLHESESTEAP